MKYTGTLIAEKIIFSQLFVKINSPYRTVIKTCADCGRMEKCPTPGQIAVNSPFVPENLNRLREAKNKIN